jgi:hypothetical protein
VIADLMCGERTSDIHSFMVLNYGGGKNHLVFPLWGESWVKTGYLPGINSSRKTRGYIPRWLKIMEARGSR